MKVSQIQGLPGFGLYTLGLICAAILMPPLHLSAQAWGGVAALGMLALWRYSWGMTHFVRSFLYRKVVFPRLREETRAGGDALMPPRVYFVLTSFRIDAATTARAYRAAIAEAAACGIEAVLVCSIVEWADEALIKDLFRAANPPPSVRLHLVRIAGTGKRDALAQAFRAVSRDLPPPGSVAAVIDGDCILPPGLTRDCAPLFGFDPRLGALTTDEDCEVEGTPLMTDWHSLRFAQRHLQMCSVALSRKVMTLTGRMSMFRAEILCDPGFIRHVQEDELNHWRLGRFKFLTGDDKSTWHWVLAQGWDMLYVPDVVVRTVEHPPSPFFIPASTRLMTRWFGNMLRINGKSAALGPARAGPFVWWCIVDQRVAMWTTLFGPLFALCLSAAHGPAVLGAFAVWIGLTRWVMTLMLLAARPEVSWRYPFLLYYNQIWGACVKSYIFFRLDRQSWTRQNTRLDRHLGPLAAAVLRWSSLGVHVTALACLVAFVGVASGVWRLPRL